MLLYVVMVYGWFFEMGNIEVVFFFGVCCLGMYVYKYVYMLLKFGEVYKVVILGLECFFCIMCVENFEFEVVWLIELE